MGKMRMEGFSCLKWVFYHKMGLGMIFVSCRGSCLDRSVYRGASHSTLHQVIKCVDQVVMDFLTFRRMEGFSYLP